VPRALIDERELHRPGPTYTVDTLLELRAEQPGAQLFLVMGEDQSGSLTRWHDWQSVVALAVICYAARAATQGEVRSDLPREARSQPLVLPAMPESATQVRALVQAGADVHHLVPAGIARYIETHHLYRST